MTRRWWVLFWFMVAAGNVVGVADQFLGPFDVWAGRVLLAADALAVVSAVSFMRTDRSYRRAMRASSSTWTRSGETLAEKMASISRFFGGS